MPFPRQMKHVGLNRMGTRTLVTPPATEPVIMAEAKNHARVDTDADNDMLSRLIVAARKHIERRAGVAMITQTWKLQLDHFPRDGVIRLLPVPVQSVASVEFTDSDDSTTTVSGSTYVVDTASRPSRVVLKRDENWPTDLLRSAGSVEVTFDAGYGDDPADVPETLRQAILLLAGHWYCNREHVVVGANVTRLPDTIDALIGSESVQVVA